jgi:RimJ/RimL family protein N-acetyltransferase
VAARTSRGIQARAGAERTAAIRRLTSPLEVRRLLYSQRAYAAYAIAYLDPSLFALAGFYEAAAGERRALLMHSRGGLGSATLTLGDPELVAALLKLHLGPRQTFLTCAPEHVDAILVSHNLWRPQTMLRMQLERGSFVAPALTVSPRRLIEVDAPELNWLYSIEEDGLRYSGRQVREGVYYGADVRGRLVAAAGTHVYSRAEGVAVIGNVFTHPDHRGRGLGTAVTAAVAASVLKTCELVVLNVDPGNRPARHIYDQLGFQPAGRLVEAMATRREPFSPVSGLRRLAARWRSAQPGVEVAQL